MVIEQNASQVALTVDVEGKLEHGIVTMTTRDNGLSHEAGKDRHGHQQLGLTLIQALVDVFDVQTQTNGRTIVLERRMHPAPR